MHVAGKIMPGQGLKCDAGPAEPVLEVALCPQKGWPGMAQVTLPVKVRGVTSSLMQGGPRRA